MDRDRRPDRIGSDFLEQPASRRALLKGFVTLMAAGAVAPLAAACAQQTAAPAPTAAPSKQAEAKPAETKPAESKPAAAQPTPAPKVEAKPAEAAKPAAGEPRRGGTLKIALIGEPPHLDMQFGTQTVTRYTMSHVFETLYAPNEKQDPVPLLAEKHEVSADAKTWTFTLRKNVLFHNDKEMTSADVVASLNRWGSMGTLGKQIFARLESIDAKDKYSFTMSFKQPTGVLLSFLSEGSSFVMPEEIANEFPKDKLAKFVGTGPFKFVEHLPDRHIRVARWDKYTPLEMLASFMAGKRVAYVDEIRFIPVPEGSVRADGVGTNEYHFAESLAPDLYDTVKAQPNVTPVIVKPYYWFGIHFNNKESMFRERRLRQAVLAALSMEPIVKAAVGHPDFYRLGPELAGPETSWYNDEGKDVYNKPDPEKAKALLKEAGYDGTPVRWMSTQEYFWSYNGSVPAKQQLEAVGFKIDLQVMDWATLGRRRADPKEWDVFITGHESYTHPIRKVYLSASWPTFWDNAEKDKLVSDLFAEADPQKQNALIRQIQALQWREVPIIKIADYFQLQSRRNELKGYEAPPDWFWWNAWLG